MKLDQTRNALLTDFGMATLNDRYLLPGEGPQEMFSRVATAFSDDENHAQRIYDYISKLWFMPATPVLSNGGATRGLPISCFLNAVGDSLEDILDAWNENVWLAANGGGIGTYWGGVREIGAKVKGAGTTSGIIPFIHIMDSMTLGISQGSLRRGSAAVYVDIFHPEIEEFLEIRKSSGDFNRKALNLHHGIGITDEFMFAVRDNTMFPLVSPKTGETTKLVHARSLWQKILEIRMATGEPYLIYVDNVNKAMPQHQRELGLRVKQSNLCAEIMLHTGIDHLGVDRTAVCCLSSVNAETFLEWRDQPQFIEDVMRFLDNVLQDFIDRAPPQMASAIYAATRERSVGLGLMGFHSFLQRQNVPFGGPIAKVWNRRLFKHLRVQADAASKVLAFERGACPDATERGVQERFSHKLAIAPTASISIICGGTSAGIDPIPANIYTHKTLSGSFTVKNPYLDQIILAHAGEVDDPAISQQEYDRCWNRVLADDGSVKGLDWMSDDDKAVFATSFEIDQRWVVELAADRAPEICQSQSLNIFLPGNVDKWDLHMLHWKAWEDGIKSMYYLRSLSVQRAAFAGGEEVENDGELTMTEPTLYDECLACQ